MPFFLSYVHSNYDILTTHLYFNIFDIQQLLLVTNLINHVINYTINMNNLL